MTMRHHWNAPPYPATTPPTATVVVKSNCGERIYLPLWRLREWEAKGNKPEDTDCATCLAEAPFAGT